MNQDEEVKNWQRHSDMVFTAISTSGARDFAEAERMAVHVYVPDMSVSRAGISHALKRLERHYKQSTPQKQLSGEPK